MTFEILRALHNIIGDALDEAERVYADTGNSQSPSASVLFQTQSTPTSKPPSFLSNAYASPPPSPSVSMYPQNAHKQSSSHSSFTQSSMAGSLDFPSLDQPYDPNSTAEALISHPAITSSINRIVAAAGQISAMVQVPFLTICDATMGYHLPACMRLLEASHIVEILREAGPSGLHVRVISEKTGVEGNILSHVLRLLATHHILREISLDVFTNNRLSSILDTGKSYEEIRKSPERKYENTNGTAAFVGMCTDELFKSSAYLTEAYMQTKDPHKSCNDPTRAPFNYAFHCEGTGFFSWLEGKGIQDGRFNGALRAPGPISELTPLSEPEPRYMAKASPGYRDKKSSDLKSLNVPQNPNQFRLERFGKAMSGTEGWEVPGAILSGFDWHSLPSGSIIVDVGGGIGSTSMMLASAFSGIDGCLEADNLGLKFIIQDRGHVVDIGEKAWKVKCPELLDSGIARFQEHDFFTPQPIKNAAVFLLRVILHDWPDAYVQRILLRLREAANEDTRLLLADFILPLACVDDLEGNDNGEAGIGDIQGAEKTLAPPPLLPNLGKASANVYWMDLTMHCMFNSQERSLREVVALCRATGWKVTRVVKQPGSLFGHITAVPVIIPSQNQHRVGLTDTNALIDRSTLLSMDGDISPAYLSRCGTPTFGSRTELPSLEEARSKFGQGLFRGIGRRMGGALKPSILKNGPTSGASKKKKPSPLSALPSSPSSSSPRPSAPHSPRRIPQAALFKSPGQSAMFPPTTPLRPPSSPMAPRHPTIPLSKRPSLAQLDLHRLDDSPPPLPSVSPGWQYSDPYADSIPFTPTSPTASRLPLNHRSSNASMQPQGWDESFPLPFPAPNVFNLSHSVSTQSLRSFASDRNRHVHSTTAAPFVPPQVPESPRELPRRKSHAHLSSPNSTPRKRSGSIIGPLVDAMRSLHVGNGTATTTSRVLAFDRDSISAPIESDAGTGSLLAAPAFIGGTLNRMPVVPPSP